MLPLGVNSIELSHIFLVRQEEKNERKKKAFSSLMRRYSSTDVRVFSLLGPMELEENEEKKANERKRDRRRKNRPNINHGNNKQFFLRQDQFHSAQKVEKTRSELKVFLCRFYLLS